MADVLPAPNGCRHCGINKPGHDQRWAPEVKWHGFAEPTDEQRLTRMKARRAANHVHTEACLCVMVPMDVEGASECHYCGVHGAYGKPCGDRCDVARAEVTAHG